MIKKRDKQPLIMNSGKVLFAVFQYMGIWRPKSWTSKWVIQMYRMYSLLSSILLVMFTTSSLVYSLKLAEDLDSMTESFLIFLLCGAANLKMFNILGYRIKIIEFDDMFLSKFCDPRDSQEAAIKSEFEYNDRTKSLTLLTVFSISELIVVMTPLLSKSNVRLPFEKTWLPYSIESSLAFGLTYFYQAWSSFTLGLLTTSIDVYVATMMQQISAQLDICKHRLQTLPKLLEEHHEKSDKSQYEQKILQDWIFYHKHIFAIGGKLNEIFGTIVFTQFFVTILALCIVIFHLAKIKEPTPTFWLMVAGLNDCFIEIFIYCWYGEEMINNSADVANALYNIDWDPLSTNAKKYFVVIMMRASKPIKLNWATMFTFSIDTLIKILKTSYSAFNVLRSSKYK